MIIIPMNRMKDNGINKAVVALKAISAVDGPDTTAVDGPDTTGSVEEEVIELVEYIIVF